MLYAIVSVLFVQMDNGFSVAVGTVAVATRLKLPAKLGVIVDFAVEDDPDGTSFVAYWLMTAGDVNDAQAAHADGDAAIGINALIIGTAVHHHSAHLAHRRRIYAGVLPEFHYSRDAAHIKSPKPVCSLAYRTSCPDQLSVEKLQ